MIRRRTVLLRGLQHPQDLVQARLGLDAGVVEVCRCARVFGLGGAGREDSNGANGGYGGDLEISLQDGASVSTDGTMSHGIVGRSVGGSGGQYVPSSGFVDFSPNYAGTGGRGGLVAADIGLSYDSGRNAWVRTEKSTR